MDTLLEDFGKFCTAAATLIAKRKPVAKVCPPAFQANTRWRWESDLFQGSLLPAMLAPDVYFVNL
jgi:hypothetical protein